MISNYQFSAADLVALLARKWFPERTDAESKLILEWLQRHGAEFDRFEFSARVGQGDAIDPSLSPALQRQAAFNTKKRIDILAWRGSQPVIHELKFRVTPSALGQILTYRHLFREEFPDALDPELVVIGRTSDEDTLRVLAAHDVTVYLYTETDVGAADEGVRV